MNRRRWFLAGLAALSLAAAPVNVGSAKCKGCHKVQHDSWAASKHAKAKVDCETCHGPGSEYKALKVMKDKAASMKAGLLMPGKAECGKCHGKGKVPAITDALFAKVHAHKKK